MCATTTSCAKKGALPGAPLLLAAAPAAVVAATATAVIGSAIIVIDQQDQDDNKEQPSAVSVAKQVFQTHIHSPPFAVTFHTMPQPQRGAKKATRRPQLGNIRLKLVHFGAIRR